MSPETVESPLPNEVNEKSRKGRIIVIAILSAITLLLVVLGVTFLSGDKTPVPTQISKQANLGNGGQTVLIGGPNRDANVAVPTQASAQASSGLPPTVSAGSPDTGVEAAVPVTVPATPGAAPVTANAAGNLPPMAKSEPSDKDERYFVLEALQANCQKQAMLRHGSLDIANRNFCACYATKMLGSMNEENVEIFRKTEVMPPNSAATISQISNQCSAL